MIILKIVGVICLLIVLYNRLTSRFVQPYQCNMVIGKAGTGKSMTMTKLAHKYLSEHRHVYSSEKIAVWCKDPKTHKKVLLETKEIDPKRLYSYSFPPGSVILLDEIGTIFSSREFKTFDKRNRNFFKYYRHDKLIIWMWSQSFDCDLVIRNMVTQFWLAEKYLRVFCVMRRLIMQPVVVHPQGDAPSSIQDDFVEDPKLLRPVLGGLKITFIPRWINQHDSFYLPEAMLNERVNDFSADPVPLKSYTLRDRVTDRRRARRVRRLLGLGNAIIRLRRTLMRMHGMHRPKVKSDKSIFKAS